MTSAEQAERLMQRYGRQVEFLPLEEKYRCFLQPMRYKNKMFLDSQYTQLGVVDESCFLYIGPPWYEMTEGVNPLLEDTEGNQYICVKSETVYGTDGAMYEWAILRLGVQTT